MVYMDTHSTLVRTIQQIELSFMESLKKVQAERKLYIQFGYIHCKRKVKLSDAEIQRRSNECGIAIISMTNRSITLRASNYQSYDKARKFF